MKQTCKKLKQPESHSGRTLSLLALMLCVWSVFATLPAHAADTVRVGALKFGTVNWELDTVIRNGYDRKHNLSIEVIPFSNKQATPIAFFNGSLDMFVTDWLWVSRARNDGKDISFIPYSKSLGALMVTKTSSARALADLGGQRVGVAGGPYDKSWLLLRAWAQQEHKLNLPQAFAVEFAAPPLLNGQIQHGNLDAVLNFWHYCARLESAGYRRLVDMGTVLEGLGIRNTPMVGYVFDSKWARANDGIVSRFNLAVRKARSRLMNDDDEWEKLKPLMKVPDEDMFITLRKRYREGIPKQWGEEDYAAARKLTKLFHTIGGTELTASEKLAPGTFWTKAYF